MASQFKAPKGTFDVLGPASARYAALVALFAEHAARYGFDLLVQPMFEDIGVFQRIGGSTDVVRKEMYDFEDKGGRHIALRPRGARRRRVAPISSTTPQRRGRFGTRARSSGTTVRRRAATASTTRSASKRSARPTPISTSRSFRSRVSSTPRWASPASRCASRRWETEHAGPRIAPSSRPI